MSGEIATLLVSWNSVQKNAHDPRMFSEYLTHLVRESEFHLTDQTKWAYAKVATFLEDGWQSQQQYTKILPHCPFNLDQIGVMLNGVVSGFRYDKTDADKVGAKWLGRGVWPTERDRAAILFYVSCESP
jgi:hypothetical protein